MRTEDLIVELAGDLRPVRVLAPPVVRWLRWTTVAALSAGAAVWWFEARADLAAALRSPVFLGEILLVILVALVSGHAAMVSAVPGAAGARPARAVAMAVAIGWAAAVFWRVDTETGAPLSALLYEPSHWACPLRLAAAGLVPAGVVWIMVRRAAPLEPVWSAALAALAASATGAAAVQLTCPIDLASHVFNWHVLPVGVLVACASVSSSVSRKP